jgi:hypothetical protein
LTEHTAIGTSNWYALRPQGLEAARAWLTFRWDSVMRAYAEAAQDRERSQKARQGNG